MRSRPDSASSRPHSAAAAPSPAAQRLIDGVLDDALREFALDAARTALRELAASVIANRRMLGAAEAGMAASSETGGLPVAAGTGCQGVHVAAAAAAAAALLADGKLRVAARPAAASPPQPLPQPPPHSTERAARGAARAPSREPASADALVRADAHDTPATQRAARAAHVDRIIRERRTAREFERSVLPAALSSGWVREVVLDALEEVAAETAAVAAAARARASPPPPPPDDADAGALGESGGDALIEAILLANLTAQLGRAGDGTDLREAVGAVQDGLLAQLLLRRTLAVAQRREEARPDRPAGAMHAQLTSELLIDSMVSKLVGLPCADAKEAPNDEPVGPASPPPPRPRAPYSVPPDPPAVRGASGAAAGANPVAREGATRTRRESSGGGRSRNGSRDSASSASSRSSASSDDASESGSEADSTESS
jgi:hypothetical protein